MRDKKCGNKIDELVLLCVHHVCISMISSQLCFPQYSHKLRDTRNHQVKIFLMCFGDAKLFLNKLNANKEY
jgi:hypothetical protein